MNGSQQSVSLLEQNLQHTKNLQARKQQQQQQQTVAKRTQKTELL